MNWHDYLYIFFGIIGGCWTVGMTISTSINKKFAAQEDARRQHEERIQQVLDKHEKDIHEKIGRSYARLDLVKIGNDAKFKEIEETANKKFMTRELHEAEMKGLNQNIDQRFISMMQVLTIKIEGQEKAYSRLEETIKNHLNKDGNR